MSIASELTNLENNIGDSYDAVDDMGGIIPAHKNMANLDQAIRTIPQNSGITATTFHWGGSPNNSMYKDSGYTTAATYSDIATAYAAGLVYIADGEDELTYVVVSDIPDAHTITVTSIALPGYEGGTASYTYASSTWTKTATEFQTKLTAGTNVQINGTTISATDTTYSAFTGATSSVAGAAGLVPAPTTSDPDKFLKGDGTWGTPADTGGVLIGYMNVAHGSATISDTGVYTDNTYTTLLNGADVFAALNAGKAVFFRYNDGEDDIRILSVSAIEVDPFTGDKDYIFMATSRADCIAEFPCVEDSWHIYTFESRLKNVGNGTLTIQHNGTTVQTFFANQSTAATANIETIYADTITPTTAVATIGTTQIADAAVTSSKIDWNSAISSAAFESLGEPAHLTDISNNSKLIGDRLLSVNFKAKITTSNSSYVQVGQFTSLPHNIGYEAALSVQQEGTTNIFRYAYLESNGKFVVATGSAVSNQTIRVSGFIPLIGT